MFGEVRGSGFAHFLDELGSVDLFRVWDSFLFAEYGFFDDRFVADLFHFGDCLLLYGIGGSVLNEFFSFNFSLAFDLAAAYPGSDLSGFSGACLSKSGGCNFGFMRGFGSAAAYLGSDLSGFSGACLSKSGGDNDTGFMRGFGSAAAYLGSDLSGFSGACLSESGSGSNFGFMRGFGSAAAYLGSDLSGFSGACLSESGGGNFGFIRGFGSAAAYLGSDLSGFSGACLSESGSGSNFGFIRGFGSAAAYPCSDLSGFSGACLSESGGGFFNFLHGFGAEGSAFSAVGEIPRVVTEHGALVGSSRLWGVVEACENTRFITEKNYENKIRMGYITEKNNAAFITNLIDGCVRKITSELKDKIAEDCSKNSFDYGQYDFYDGSRVIDRVARSLGAALEFGSEGVHS